MAKPIVVWPAKVLTTPAGPVTDFGAALESLLQQMQASMVEAEGIGIAAPQIGVPLRVALVAPEGVAPFEIVNPQVLSAEGPISLLEGCLSVPGQFEQTPRFEKVRVRFQDRQGAWHEQDAEGRLAHVFQHEIDHLDGRVFVDKLSQLKRSLIRGRMRKLRHPDEED